MPPLQGAPPDAAGVAIVRLLRGNGRCAGHTGSFYSPGHMPSREASQSAHHRRICHRAASLPCINVQRIYLQITTSSSKCGQLEGATSPQRRMPWFPVSLVRSQYTLACQSGYVLPMLRKPPSLCCVPQVTDGNTSTTAPEQAWHRRMPLHILKLIPELCEHMSAGMQCTTKQRKKVLARLCGSLANLASPPAQKLSRQLHSAPIQSERQHSIPLDARLAAPRFL